MPSDPKDSGARDRRLADLEAENAELRRVARLHQAFLESVVDYAVFTADLELRITSWNAGGERLLGWRPEEIIGQPAHVLFTEEDRARGIVEEEAQTALAKGRASNERWHVRKDGTRFWGSGLTMPLRDGHTLHGFIKIMRDQTERRRSEQRQKLLLGELTHRVKNTLTIVQSLAAQTLRSAPDPVTFTQSYNARLSALARAHDLLTTEVWEKANIAGVCDAALGAWMTEGRITASGRDVWLTASQAVTLSLALHELATNAAKYGALSVPEGRVDLAWEGEEVVELTWIERGGPPVSQPSRSGFGSLMLTRALANDLKGNVALDYLPTGVRFTLRFKPPDLSAAGKIEPGPD